MRWVGGGGGEGGGVVGGVGGRKVEELWGGGEPQADCGFNENPPFLSSPLPPSQAPGVEAKAGELDKRNSA